MHINLFKEIRSVVDDAEDLGATVPECGAASAGFRLGWQAAISAVRDRMHSRRLGEKIQAVQSRVDQVAESDDQIVAALKAKLDSLKHSRYMTKACGPSEYRQAGANRMNATPTEDKMIALLESILKGES